MDNVNGLSNFETFQRVLHKGVERPSPGKTVAQPTSAGKLRVRESPPTIDILPFIRQTTRWDHESRRELEHLEFPNDDWTTWTSFDKKEMLKSWVRQESKFDKLGDKVDYLLVSKVVNIPLMQFKDLEESDEQTWTSIESSEQSFRDDRILTIKDERFRDLFFEIMNIESIRLVSLPNLARKVLEVLKRFIDYIFPGAKEIFLNSCTKSQVSFSNVWALFPPGTIVYENRSIPPFRETYEQCFRVRSAEDSISHYDGTTVLRLILEEITYRTSGFIECGPNLVITTRDIRNYNGLKHITTEELGVIPLNMIPKGEQKGICTRVRKRSRQFLHLAALPFSIWNYKGPLTLVSPTIEIGSMEESRFSSAERIWQKHTHENVIVDVAVFETYFHDRYKTWAQNFLDADNTCNETEPIEISSIDTSDTAKETDKHYAEQCLLICRGYLPAYLLSSSVYAVHILVDQLTPAIWEQTNLSGLEALSPLDMSQWYPLIRAYLEERNDLEVRLRRRETRGAGFVIALQGPKIMTKMVAENIGINLKRPLVSRSSTDEDQKLSEISKATIKWGGILFIDHHRIPTDQRAAKSIELANHFSLYPSIVLVSCNDVTELGTACEEEIDGVIACNISSKDQTPELWKLYLTRELPDFTKGISTERLSDACHFLAQFEHRETRMAKVLKTASRLAVAESSPLDFSHVFAVIRSSLSMGELEKFDNLVKAGDCRP